MNSVDAVALTSEQIAITKNGSPAAVLVGADEWESLQETLYWLSQPGIRESTAEADRREDDDRGIAACLPQPALTPLPERNRTASPSICPPSITMVSPVIQLAESETRNAIAAAISAGSPIRSNAVDA
jgi:prevent-host-death family protein